MLLNLTLQVDPELIQKEIFEYTEDPYNYKKGQFKNDLKINLCAALDTDPLLNLTLRKAKQSVSEWHGGKV